MEATVQLNVRMSRELKKSGDEALALIGLSPTAAVRALWEKASRRGEDLEQVAQLLAPAKKEAYSTQGEHNDPFAEIHAEIDAFYRQHGIDPKSKWEYDDKELLEEALYERFVEKGLM